MPKKKTKQPLFRVITKTFKRILVIIAALLHVVVKFFKAMAEFLYSLIKQILQAIYHVLQLLGNLFNSVVFGVSLLIVAFSLLLFSVAISLWFISDALSLEQSEGFRIMRESIIKNIPLVETLSKKTSASSIVIVAPEKTLLNKNNQNTF